MALIEDPITAGIKFANAIIDKVWPDKTQENLARLEMLRDNIANAFQLQMAQIQANAAQAQSASLFVAGPRPFIMWICGFSIFYQFLVRTIVPWAFAVAGHPVPPMPGLDEMLWELTATTLGMAGWRSYDKKNGVA